MAPERKQLTLQDVVNSLARRVRRVEQENSNLKKRIDELEKARVAPEEAVRVHFYDRTPAWTSAPHPETEVGQFGEFGQAGPSILAIEPGDYVLLNTYAIKTDDYGQIRWLQVRTALGDGTVTPDGFAWLPVQPHQVDAEALYKALQEQDPEVEIDEYTASVWENMS